MSKNLLQSLVSVALIAGTSYASADTLSVSSFAVGGGDITATLNGQVLDGEAGKLSGSLNGSSFTTYCVELTEDLNPGQVYTDYTLVNGVTAWGAQKSSAFDHVLSFFAATNYPTNPATSVAAQAALWEVLYETSPTYDFNSGTFSIVPTDTDPTVRAASQAALDSLDTEWSAMLAAPITLHADLLQSPTGQDLMEITPVTAPVPEPSSYAMILAGLAGVSVVSRRRSSRG